MGEISAISWTDATFNGWIGCTKVGPPCDFCYAADTDARYQYGVPKAERRTDGSAPHWGPGAPRHRTAAAYWRNPLKWNEAAKARGVPMKVFAHSLSDVFDNEVDESWRADLFALWRETPWLRWIVVSKRVPNMPKMLPKDWGDGYPNVGLVATTGDQDEFDRDAPRLLAVPARWHGFSLEPQLGFIDPAIDAVTKHRGSIWLITGGESRQPEHARSGIAPRSYDLAWTRVVVRSAILRPNLYAFVKQSGANPVGGFAVPTDGMGKDPMQWPPDVRAQHFPPELLA